LVRDQRAGRGGADGAFAGADDDDANAAAGGEREEMVTGGGEGWAREKGRPGPCAAAWAGGRSQRTREERLECNQTATLLTARTPGREMLCVWVCVGVCSVGWVLVLGLGLG
jgi:hypothetical protein